MPAPKEKQPIDLDSYRGTQHQETTEVLPQTVLIYGQAGAGKTTCAATAFGDVRTHLATPQADRLELKGAIWLLSDDQGLSSLTARNVYPEYVIDVKQLINRYDGDADTALRDIHELIRAMAKAGATHVVSDTDTILMHALADWYVFGAGCPISNGGAANTMQGWMRLGKARRDLHRLVVWSGLRSIILCHADLLKSDEDNPFAASGKQTLADREKSKAKQATITTAGECYLVPSVLGRATAKLWNAESAIMSWIAVHEDKRNGRQRVLYTRGGEGAMGKCRYETILGEVEKPDLLAIDRKILAASGLT